MDHVVDQCLFRLVDVAHKLLQSFVRVEDFGFVRPVRLHLAAIGQCQSDASVQESQLAESVGEDVVFVFGHGEDRRVRFELYGCPGTITVTRYPNISQRLAAGELLHVDFAVTVHFSFQMGRQRIDTRDTDAVQSTRHFIGALVKLTSGMEYSQHDLQCRFTFLLVVIDRNASPIIRHADRIILTDHDIDILAEAGQCFVDGVVYHLVNQMVESLLARVADVHGWAFTDGLQPLEHLDVLGRVFLACCFYFFVTHVDFLSLFIIKYGNKYSRSPPKEWGWEMANCMKKRPKDD